MNRILLAAVSATALSAPALADHHDGNGEGDMERDPDALIDMSLVSPDEITGATVYFADGEEAGDVVSYETEDGDVTSLLVHHFDMETVVDRYRITGEDIVGYDAETRRVELRLDSDEG